MIDSTESELLLRVTNLKMHFPVRKGVLKRTVGAVKAVDGVDLSIFRGETLGLVGESGSGKTTLGRCMIRLIEPTSGTVEFNRDGTMIDLLSLRSGNLRSFRRDVQVIFQDPFSSLNSRMSVGDIITEPLDVHQIGTKSERKKRAESLLEKVGMEAGALTRYPHEFSGGQRQRIGIARALSIEPTLIVCDEPVSALDVSVQSQVLNLLADIQSELGLTYLFITHDLSVAYHICDRLVVLYLGRVMEVAPVDKIYATPLNPYTEALLSAIPVVEGSPGKRFVLKGSIPNPANPPCGCRFHTRCPYVQDICKSEEPEIRNVKGGSDDHQVACHLAEELRLRGC